MSVFVSICLIAMIATLLTKRKQKFACSFSSMDSILCELVVVIGLSVRFVEKQWELSAVKARELRCRSRQGGILVGRGCPPSHWERGLVIVL